MLIKLSILLLCHTIIAETKVLYDLENVEDFGDLLKDHNKNDEPERKETIEHFRDNWDSKSIVYSNDYNYNDELGYLSKFFDKSSKGRETVFQQNADQHMRTSRCGVIKAKMPREAPEAFDWRDKNVVTSVKDQSRCFSDWAYAVTGNVESLHAIKHKELLDLSTQQILDCDLESNGCGGGGDLANPFTMLVKRAGMQTQTDYPNRNPPEKRRCAFNESQIAVKVVGCNAFQYDDEADIKEVLYRVGPLAIRFDRLSLRETKDINTYCSCGVVNTGALLVGYGTENGTDYWTLKISLSTKFADEGYIRVKRGVRCLCIGEEVYSAVIG